MRTETRPIPTADPSGRASSAKSFLAQDVEITGTLTFRGELTFDGTIKDGFITGNVLTIGEHAVVDVNLSADDLTIAGVVNGNATAARRCHLRPTARLTGEIYASRLVIEDGATFIGSITAGEGL